MKLFYAYILVFILIASYGFFEINVMNLPFGGIRFYLFFVWVIAFPIYMLIKPE